MKPLNTYINESNSNIDKFIEFILSDSKEGELETCHKSWYDYYDKCDLFANQKFSQNVDYFDIDIAETYCEENGLETVFDDKEGFSEYVKTTLDDNDLFVFEFERGLILCERVIDVKEDNYDKYEGHLGKYWSFIRGAGDSHGSTSNSRNDVVVYALVDPKDVDWAETIAANLTNPEEYEITLYEDAPIQITKIVEKRTNKTLLEKDILYYA